MGDCYKRFYLEIFGNKKVMKDVSDYIEKLRQKGYVEEEIVRMLEEGLEKKIEGKKIQPLKVTRTGMIDWFSAKIDKAISGSGVIYRKMFCYRDDSGKLKCGSRSVYDLIRRLCENHLIKGINEGDGIFKVDSKELSKHVVEAMTDVSLNCIC